MRGQLTEAQIERRLAQGARERGGMCLKFTSPGAPGVPDRIVIAPDGRVYFVELKAQYGRLSGIQRWMTGEMRKRNADVRVLNSADAVKDFLEEVMPHEV